jgi:alanyl-tRNA synthetase
MMQGLAVMMFSVDNDTNKVLVYAGVPDVVASKGLVLINWLRKALEPINGKGGGGKGGLAQGQVNNSRISICHISLFQFRIQLVCTII